MIRFCFFVVLISLTLCMSTSGLADENLSGQVTWVYDGDTLEVVPHGKVRLIGIDTPEKDASRRDIFLINRGVPAVRQRVIYQAAKEFNITHVKGLRVTLEPGEPNKDRYGRLLAYVHLPDGRILNQLLLEEGLAVVYRKFTFKRKDAFLDAEKSAIESRVGLWRPPQEEPSK